MSVRLAGGVLAKPAVQLYNIGFGYPGQDMLFRGAEFTVDRCVGVDGQVWIERCAWADRP